MHLRLCQRFFASVCFNVIPEAPIKITKPLKDKKVKEQETATFECELSRPVEEVTWLCNGKPVALDDRVKVTSDGKKHSLTFTKAVMDDAAKYTIKIGDVESSAKLTVEGRLGISLSTQYGTNFQLAHFLQTPIFLLFEN